MYLRTIVILLSIGNTFCDFLPVPDGCEYWNYLKIYENGEEKKVHCILDQHFQSGLVYTEWKMIPNGTCPIYNRFARQIDNIPCNRNIGMCPDNTFPSYSGVTFTGCYDAIKKQANVIRPTTNENVHVPPTVSDHGNYAAPSVIIATLSACINCMFIIACVWHFICRSKIKLCRDEYGMPRVGKTPDHIATEPVPGIGANGECGMTRMRVNKNEVLDASKLAVDMHELGSIRPKSLAYRESKAGDAKVQTAPRSRHTSETYSQISSADSKASEDNLVFTERGREQCYIANVT